jgi:hypothetical protein
MSPGRNILVFGLGLVTLLGGWVALPRVLYVQKQPPSCGILVSDDTPAAEAQRSGNAAPSSPRTRSSLLAVS